MSRALKNLNKNAPSQLANHLQTVGIAICKPDRIFYKASEVSFQSVDDTAADQQQQYSVQCG